MIGTMFAWLVFAEDHLAVLGAAVAKAWSGGDAVVAHLELAGRKTPRRIAVAWAERAKARRSACWPDVLDDWKDIYEEALQQYQDSKFLDVVLYNYGRCLVKMKKLDEALAKFNQLISTYPNSKMVGNAQKIVEAIQKRIGGGAAPATSAAPTGSPAPVSTTAPEAKN